MLTMDGKLLAFQNWGNVGGWSDGTDLRPSGRPYINVVQVGGRDYLLCERMRRGKANDPQ